MKKFAFTVIEIIIVIGIFIIVSLIVFGWQKDIFSFQEIFRKKISFQEQVRKIVKDFTAEVRTAQYSSLGSYPIEEATKSSFIFYSNIDNDQLVERIRYFLDGKKLKKGIIKPSGQPLRYNPADEKVIELIDFVINPNQEIFLYYDKNYTGTGNPLPFPVNISSIRLVKMIITIDDDLNRPPEAITETIEVTIRNLKDNL
jgi:type II secretory pathway pseudopilin PulG